MQVQGQMQELPTFTEYLVSQVPMLAVWIVAGGVCLLVIYFWFTSQEQERERKREQEMFSTYEQDYYDPASDYWGE